MADEITVSGRIRVDNANLNFERNIGSKTFDQTALGGPTPGFVSIGTTEESFAFGELSTLGWCLLENLDATNYIDWGFSTGVYGGRLEPGEFAIFRLRPATTLYAVANTATCKALIYAIED